MNCCARQFRPVPYLPLTPAHPFALCWHNSQVLSEPTSPIRNSWQRSPLHDKGGRVSDSYAYRRVNSQVHSVNNVPHYGKAEWAEVEWPNGKRGMRNHQNEE